MKRSNRLILLIGVFLAIVAFIGIVLIVQGKPSGGGPTTASELPTVFAAKPITLGTEITADMLQVTTTKVTERDTTAFSSPSLLLGKIAAKDIAQGKQLTADDFNRGGNQATVTVPVGMRAIAVTVDQNSGVGTLIRVGDYVDLLVGITGDKFPVITLNSSDDSFQVVSGINATSAKVLLQGMQVIGTLLPPPPANNNNNAQAQAGAEDRTSLNNQSEIVILAVTAQQAEAIKFAQMDGSISLVLRSPKDFRDEGGNPIAPAPAGTTGVTLRVLVDEYRVLIPQLVETAVPAQARPR